MNITVNGVQEWLSKRLPELVPLLSAMGYTFTVYKNLE